MAGRALYSFTDFYNFIFPVYFVPAGAGFKITIWHTHFGVVRAGLDFYEKYKRVYPPATLSLLLSGKGESMP